MESSEWKKEAETLFFIEKMKIGEIAKHIGISRRSVSKHLNGVKGYSDEIGRRKAVNADRRTEYKRRWDRKNRPNRYNVVNAETMRHEHDVAAAILSREKYR